MTLIRGINFPINLEEPRKPRRETWAEPQR